MAMNLISDTPGYSKNNKKILKLKCIEKEKKYICKNVKTKDLQTSDLVQIFSNAIKDKLICEFTMGEPIKFFGKNKPIRLETEGLASTLVQDNSSNGESDKPRVFLTPYQSQNNLFKPDNNVIFNAIEQNTTSSCPCPCPIL